MNLSMKRKGTHRHRTDCWLSRGRGGWEGRTGSLGLADGNAHIYRMDKQGSTGEHRKLYSNQFSCSVMSDSLQPHGLQHARPPCPSPSPGAYSNSCPSSRWCHPTISSSVVPFSSCPQSFPASGSFPVSQFFASGGQRIGASASILTHSISSDKT